MSLVTSKNFIIGVIVGLIAPYVIRYVMAMISSRSGDASY